MIILIKFSLQPLYLNLVTELLINILNDDDDVNNKQIIKFNDIQYGGSFISRYFIITIISDIIWNFIDMVF
jgi:hypothetical protein